MGEGREGRVDMGGKEGSWVSYNGLNGPAKHSLLRARWICESVELSRRKKAEIHPCRVFSFF